MNCLHSPLASHSIIWLHVEAICRKVQNTKVFWLILAMLHLSDFHFTICLSYLNCHLNTAERSLTSPWISNHGLVLVELMSYWILHESDRTGQVGETQSCSILYSPALLQAPISILPVLNPASPPYPPLLEPPTAPSPHHTHTHRHIPGVCTFTQGQRLPTEPTFSHEQYHTHLYTEIHPQPPLYTCWIPTHVNARTMTITA